MNQALPSFSVIVPTYQRPEQLRRCLRALAGLDYPKDRFEVITINDGGRVPLEPVIAPFRERINITLLTQPKAGPAEARNRGVAHSKGTFLAFTDDDCAPDTGWLKVLAERFAIAPDHMIGGQTVNALSGNMYSIATQQLISYLYAYYSRNGRTRLFTSNNMAVPAELFHKVGGFNTRFPLAAGEDREFCDRWLHYGYKMTYAPEATVYHAHALTLHSFYRQHFNYGRGAFHFHRLRAQRGLSHVKVEPFSFYMNLLRYPFYQVQLRQALPVAALLVVSQLANATGYFRERGKESIYRLLMYVGG